MGMALQQPKSMDELVYYTSRDLGKGDVRMWVFRKQCPKCGTQMAKPKDSRGKVRVRTKEYVCSKCGHKEENKAYEDSLLANVEYTCPQCSNRSETQVPFKRKLIEGVPTIRITCGKCGSNIDVTKKMKEKKGKE